MNRLPKNFIKKFVIAPQDAERIDAENHPELGTPCWIWTASKNWDGYGQFRWGGRQQLAHRVSYQILVGAIPPGLELDHLCRVRDCVNPAHLESVTSAENTRRGKVMGNTWNLGHTWARGEKCGLSKLTANQVIEIRTRYAEGGVLQQQLATEFGVKENTISQIINFKRWKHL